jgi:hypothetical protein
MYLQLSCKHTDGINEYSCKELFITQARIFFICYLKRDFSLSYFIPPTSYGLIDQEVGVRVPMETKNTNFRVSYAFWRYVAVYCVALPFHTWEIPVQELDGTRTQRITV